MQGKIKFLGKKHFENNFIVYFMLFIILIIGIIIGSILVNRLEIAENQKMVGYLSPVMAYINNGNQLPIDILKISLLSNSKFALIICLSGFIFIGTIIIPLMVGLKGMSIGFTVGLLVKESGIKGFTFALFGLLPQYLILLPGILAISSIALSNSTINSKGKGNSLKRINRMNLLEYSLLFLCFFIIIIIGSLVESFITPYLIKIIRLNL